MFSGCCCRCRCRCRCARCRCCCRGLFLGEARQEPFWCVCIAFGTLGGRFRCPWGLLRVTLGGSWAGSGVPGYPWEGLGQAWGGLGASLGAPWGALGGLRGSMVLLGGLGGAFGGARAPPRAPGGSLGGLWGALWGALGGLRAALGGPRGTLRGHFWKTGVIAKSLVLLHKMVHFAS